MAEHIPERRIPVRYLFSVLCAPRIIRSAAVSAAATSAGPGAWDFPDSRCWRALLRPRTGALRLVPAAPACEMFRLTGRKPAATLNTYPARAWCFDILNPLWSHFSLPFPDTLSHTLSGLTEFESNVRFMDEVVFARALSGRAPD